MKVPIFYPIHCIFTTYVCTTLWVGKLIETSKKCLHGVISICAPVVMHVFGWSFKTYFGLQWDVKVNEKFSNLFSRYLEGDPKLHIKNKYEHHV